MRLPLPSFHAPVQVIHSSNCSLLVVINSFEIRWLFLLPRFGGDGIRATGQYYTSKKGTLFALEVHEASGGLGGLSLSPKYMYIGYAYIHCFL